MQVMPMSKLDIEEQEILDAYEAGKLTRVANAESQIARHRLAAEATFKKDARINIRLSSRDLRALQVRAMQEGIPYQTLVSSVLHKYVNGQLVEGEKGQSPMRSDNR
jgi:predicted DNA binding CopG/RHH family protein